MLKIRELRNQMGISQKDLAKQLGIPANTFNQYETGKREPDYETLIKIASFFGIPVDVLLGRDPDIILKELDNGEIAVTGQDRSHIPLAGIAMNDNGKWSRFKIGEPSPRIKIPVLGYVRAGIPIDAVEEVLDYEEISEEMARQGEYFALQIKGDSMEPRIQEGDVVIVRQQSDIDSGDIAVVLVNGNDATVKKFVKHENGVSLVAFNAKYEPMFYTPKEIQELPVSILGKVVELRGKL